MSKNRLDDDQKPNDDPQQVLSAQLAIEKTISDVVQKTLPEIMSRFGLNNTQAVIAAAHGSIMAGLLCFSKLELSDGISNGIVTDLGEMDLSDVRDAIENLANQTWIEAQEIIFPQVDFGGDDDDN